MRRKTFSTFGTMTALFSFVVFFAAAILLFGCGGSEHQTQKSSLLSNYPNNRFVKDWIALTITFKPNTNSEMRDGSMKAIEKLILDSIKAMRSNKFPGFSPNVLIGTSPFGDTLDYQFNIQYAAAGDTISNPPCKCANNCGVCKIIQYYIQNPTDTSKLAVPFRNIQDIIFRDDDYK